jgi:hypothetical protein
MASVPNLVRGRVVADSTPKCNIRAREVLVESRTKLISAVRSMVKTVGARISHRSSDAFSRNAAREVPQQIRDTVQPMLVSDCAAERGDQIL